MILFNLNFKLFIYLAYQFKKTIGVLIEPEKRELIYENTITL